MNNRLKQIFSFWLFTLLVSCAQIVAPSGGPKDSTPPLILNMQPEPLSTLFTGNKIEIEFDEYIKLHEPTTQILISPPQRNMPDFTIKRKSLIVEFKDSLLKNTTYTINFGEAIRDNNEGNVLGRLTYVFSTGTYLDSMQVKGKLVNALDGSAAKDALVMLYDMDVDSLPLDTLPFYFTRTNESGHFILDHLRNVPFKIFALTDENANYKFDVPEEAIAFADSMLTPTLPPLPPDTTATLDSLLTDSTEITPNNFLQNSLKEDSLSAPPKELTMLMFVEKDTVQYLVKTISDNIANIQFVYNLPVGKFRVRALNSSLPSNWRLKEFSTKRDTVSLWLKGVETDSLHLLVQADRGKIDTLEIALAKLDSTGSRPRSGGIMGKKKKQDDGKLHPSFVGKGRSPKPNNPFFIKLNHPIFEVNKDSILLTEDSVAVSFKLTVTDSAFRKFSIIYPWKADKQYEITILPHSFSDLNQVANNDTLNTSFKGMSVDELGNASVRIIPPEGQTIILELSDSKQNLIKKVSFSDTGTLEAKGLHPGKYSVKAVFDSNKNGIWDTGRYSTKRQPERTIYYSEQLDVKPNWDVDVDWDLTN